MVQQRNGKSDALRTVTANLVPFCTFPLASPILWKDSHMLSTPQASSMTELLGFILQIQSGLTPIWCRKEGMNWFGRYMKSNLHTETYVLGKGFLALVILLFIPLFIFPLFFFLFTSFRWRGKGSKSIPWARTASQALPNGSCPTSLGGKEYHNMPPYREWEDQSGRLHCQGSLGQEEKSIQTRKSYSPCQ